MTEQPKTEQQIRAGHDRLVTENRALAHMVAWRWARRTGIDVDDLEQCSMIGLLKAARAYDPARGNKFSTLAVPYCQGEVLHYLRDRCTGNGLIRLPYRWREAYPKGRKLLREGLSDEEVAKRLDMSLDEWRECVVASTAHNEELDDDHRMPGGTEENVQEEPFAELFITSVAKAYEYIPESDRLAIERWDRSSRTACPIAPMQRLWMQFKRVQTGGDIPEVIQQLTMFQVDETTASRGSRGHSRRSKSPRIYPEQASFLTKANQIKAQLVQKVSRSNES